MEYTSFCSHRVRPALYRTLPKSRHPVERTRPVRAQARLTTEERWEVHWSSVSILSKKLRYNDYDLTRFMKTTLLAGNMYMKFRTRDNTPSENQRLGEWIADETVKFGPTAIKLAQVVASRSDQFDENLISGLSKIQDSLPSFDTAHVRAPLERYRAQSDPIGCASIGAVYKGRMPETGQRVILKVHRPGIRLAFDVDLEHIERVIRAFTTLRLMDGAGLLQVLNDCKPFLYGELDFLNEAKNAKMFKRSLEGFPGVVVPEVYKIGKSHMVMEYIPGTRITDVHALRAKGHDTVELANILMRCFARQVLVTGLFHGDPHTGNISVDREGRIVWYDFGAVIQITEFKENLGKLIQAAIVNDVNDISDLLIKMNVIRPTGQRSDMRQVFAVLLQYASDMDAENFHMTMSTQKELQSKFKNVFQFQPKFIYLLRSMSTLEGICRTLDPDFSYKKFMEDSLSDMLPPIDYNPLLKDVVAVPRTVRNISDVLMHFETNQEHFRVEMKKDVVNMSFRNAAVQVALLALIYATHLVL